MLDCIGGQEGQTAINKVMTTIQNGITTGLFTLRGPLGGIEEGDG
jgi:hypothetical protein